MASDGLASKPKVVLFLGSGFSVPFGLPTTPTLGATLLDHVEDDRARVALESFISHNIRQFWETVFGWKVAMPTPTLEDHFTQIDLAANSGHHLGPIYSPKKLRAIRRMTIHRIFTCLRSYGFYVYCVGDLLKKLNEKFEISLVTTNWDAEAEGCLESLGLNFNHGVDEIVGRERRTPEVGVHVLKLHGCVNQGYCDCCRMPVRFPGLDGAVASLDLLLTEEDFRMFDGEELVREMKTQGLIWPRVKGVLRNCGVCGATLGARVGTFSYRKDLNPDAFYDTWSIARTSLQFAQRWLFIGYSLPEADIEIRHLLKSVQLARERSSGLAIDVVLKEKSAIAGERYKRFFGLSSEQIFEEGIEEWVAKRLDDYCR
jgi:hypothetical protein